jgi:hypothetical protein
MRATKAICRPSGDQAKTETPLGCAVTLRASPGMCIGRTKTWGLSPRSAMNARCAPSGDQRGMRSFGPAVSGRAGAFGLVRSLIQIVRR